jgi:hypothetical protein
MSEFLEIFFEVICKIGYFMEELGNEELVAKLFHYTTQIVDLGIVETTKPSGLPLVRSMITLVAKFDSK